MKNLIHNLVGANPSTSLAKINVLTNEQLSIAVENFIDCEPMFWPSTLEDKDIDFSKKYDFDIASCVEEEDFVMFSFIKSQSDTNKNILDILYSIYPDALNYKIGALFCDTYFAHVHNDKGSVKSAGQIMFVVENNAGHTIYSKDADGNEHTITPEKGDVILLDVWRDHAIIPNQSKGIDFMRQNAMKLVCFAID